MKKRIRNAGLSLLLIMPGLVIAEQQPYRIAGLIAGGESSWGAIIELPDGEQKFVSEGDYLGKVKIVKISKDGVVLKFPDGEKQMKLSQGGFVPMPDKTVSSSSRSASTSAKASVADSDAKKSADSQQISKAAYVSSRGSSVSDSSGAAKGGAGVVAADFTKLVNKQLTSGQVARTNGLEHLNNLSESARLVSYAYMGGPDAEHVSIDSLNSGVNLLQQAIIEGKELSITVEGDPSNNKLYIMPKPEQ